MAKDLNETFALPKDVTLTFAECGTVNAFYDSQKKQISICYELIADLYDTFKDIAKSEEDLDERVFGATIFIFYHEIGHAFVDVYSLPITGKEEDAVDQLSTFILADGTDEGEATALNGADSFLLQAQKDKQDVEDLPFYDEHSLNEQRFYNIICWVYGQNEQKYAGLVKEGLLPEERAARCNDEYRKLAQAWSTLLKPYTK